MAWGYLIFYSICSRPQHSSVPFTVALQSQDYSGKPPDASSFITGRQDTPVLNHSDIATALNNKAGLLKMQASVHKIMWRV